MVLSVMNILLLVLLLAPVSPAGAQEPASGPSLGIVAVPMANVRTEAEPKAQIATQVLLADEVRILEKRDYRYRVAIPSQGGREGWLQQEALLVPRDGGRSYLKAGSDRIVVTVPKTPALILDKRGNHRVSLYAGTRLPVLEKDGKGYTVLFPDRTRAVINAADAAPVRSPNPLVNALSPAQVGRTARMFAGIPYLAGGMTAQGMDTGGLIATVYRIHGIDLAADRDALHAKGVKVAKKDLQPGDILVFYGEGLGLYAGNGLFLHAPKRPGVQLGGIHDRRYANALQYGLRIAGADAVPRKQPAAMTADEIMLLQGLAAELPLGRRIVFWAERFIGTPYDPDPLGLYVRTNRIVADEAADCMYLTFRAVELAMSATPGEAVEQALQLRFLTEGRLSDGLVVNYGERFEYGEDMVFSGKWGRNITGELGPAVAIPGSRGREEVIILPKKALAGRTVQQRLQDGDIIYWVKDPQRRVVGEIVAHLSFVHVKDGRPRLIHASGSKDNGDRRGGGVVKEVPLADYLKDTKFIGAFVTRFER